MPNKILTNPDSDRYILVHGNCYDGFGSAYAAYLKFGKDANYLELFYDEPAYFPPPGSEVFMLDFSYRGQDLVQLYNDCYLTVIDHHKTAQEELGGEDVDWAIFDMTKSGALLTYEHLHRDDVVPKLIQYISDRDLWEFKLPDSRAIDAHIKSHEKDFGTWMHLERELEEDFDQCVIKGKAILQFQQRMVEMICKQSHIMNIAGHEVPVTNSTAFWSEVGHHLLEMHPDAPFVASYYEKANSRRVFSLRSRENFDCSEIAKKFGGGGHAQAAGFDIGIGRAALEIK